MSDVKQITGPDWDLANEDAAQWARTHVGELVTKIDETTRATIRREVAEFTRNKESITDLARRLEKVPAFSPERARLIAVTEVTRAYSEGNQQAREASGVVEGKEWLTSVDERVCPICGPMHGMIVPLNSDFSGPGGTFWNPPAHPRCRCDTAPVVILADAELGGFVYVEGGGFREVDPFIQVAERMGHDPYTTIRPPEGRAPRGQGEEYRIRRGLESKIRTQIKYRDIAQQKLQVYRGQSGMRAQWRISVAKERVGQLNKAIRTMLDIASDPYNNDWIFVQELIDGIIEHVSAARIMAA